LLWSLAACTNTDQKPAVALASPTANAQLFRKQSLALTYAAARNRDEAALLAMQRAASPEPDPAIALALFTIDRKRYAGEFVRAYPATHDALTFDYGSEFARANVAASGERFPIAAIGAIARGGDRDAFAKVLAAVATTDGRIGDAYRAQARRLIASAPPAATIAAFLALPPPTRLAAVSAIGWCRQPPAALLAYRPPPAPLPAPSSPASPSPPKGPSAAEVASLQAAIRHATDVDCALARSAQPAARHGKTPSAGIHRARSD
jgi:hypothetical protein